MISIFAGVAGLNANQRAVDVIANNIANLNTIGFKSGRVSFQESLVQTLRAGSESGMNPMQVGLGVQVGSIDNLMAQGNLANTGILTDLAIVGEGFFAVSDGQTLRYTRDGAFQLDANNRLVSASTGLAVTGWSVDPATGSIDTSSPILPGSTLTIPLGLKSVARETANIVLRGNLDATAAPGATVETTFSVFDSLGASHQVTLTFTRSATTGQWNWSTAGADFTGTATGQVTFDENGQIASSTGDLTLSLTNANGANNPIAMALDASTMTQLAGSSTAQVVSQDGLGIGTLQNYTIDDRGVITGVFSNGMAQKLGQIALARVPNPAGMERLGQNLYAVSSNSGRPNLVPPTSSGSGKISAGTLEMSNVDLSKEFADLIVFQRGFQANSRIITTADEMLQDLLTLKR